MVRSLLCTLFIAVFTFFGSMYAVLLRLIDSSGDKVVDLANFWSRLVLGIAGVRLEVEWRGTLEPGRPYVFMANHLSTVDIWALFAALPVHARFIAKKQLARIPVFGWALWAGRFILIDRDNALAARRSIEEAKARIRGGTTVLMFPEGTRSRDGRLLPFKKGGFHLAIDAGVPIVPVAIVGAREIMPRGSLFLRAGVVRMIFGEPVPTEGLSGGDRNALLGRVRGAMAAMLGEHGIEAMPQRLAEEGAVGEAPSTLPPSAGSIA